MVFWIVLVLTVLFFFFFFLFLIWLSVKGHKLSALTEYQSQWQITHFFLNLSFLVTNVGDQRLFYRLAVGTQWDHWYESVVYTRATWTGYKIIFFRMLSIVGAKVKDGHLMVLNGNNHHCLIGQGELFELRIE